ncbi:MAG: hypothetical protein A2293_11865 [Elusimicrobia bacterium RIFOXYB2_FULL_49_7]|nr:MAG: hypothetical protein A2293_11865 [Elusimicrobia bacterium RIFOXYB2_FULL_49_7]
MSEGISVGGLASGLDTNGIIDGLVAIEKQQVTRLETKQKNFELTLSSWGTLSTNLTTLSRKAEGLHDPDTFDKFKITSSDEEIVTIEGKDGGTPGSFSLGVYQLARSEKIMSKTFATSHLALDISGEFTVNRTKAAVENDPTGTDVTIKIEAGDSMKEVRDKINSAEDIGISATIIKISDTEYTLSITSKDSGADGAAYTETVGTALRDLGIFNSAGEKGNVTHKVQSAQNTSSGSDITADTLFSDIDGASVGINDTISIRGMDRNGNQISTRNFVVADPASMKVSDLLSEIEKTFNGMVTASVENGRIMVTDKTTGATSLQIELSANNESGGSLGLGGLMAVNTAGKNGILQVGTDAFFSVDGLYLHSTTNEAEDSVEGVNIKMRKADITQTIQVSIDRDLDGIKSNVQDFLDSFNMVMKYIDEQTKVKVEQKKEDESNPNDPTKKNDITKGALASDSTVGRLKSELRNMLTQQFEYMVGSKYNSLASVGIMINQYSGEYEIDEEKFKKALTNSYEDVKNLFVQRGSSEDTSFIYGRSTKNTSSGRYLINVDAKTVSLLDKNDNVLKTFNAKLSGNVLTVKEDGEAKDLSITVPATGSTIFTFSKGLGMELSHYIKTVTDTYEGFVSLRKKAVQSNIDDMEDKISAKNDYVENYRQKLIKEFSNLEQTMSRMKSQSSNMLSQLGS